MPEFLARWEVLAEAEGQALLHGQEERAAVLAQERLRLVEEAVARGEPLPWEALAQTQERLRAWAEDRRQELAEEIAQARRQGARARGYRAGAGLVTGQAVAVDRRG